MSAIDEMIEAIGAAVDEGPLGDVLAALTGAFVGLTLEVVRAKGGDDPSKPILIEGGLSRDITIHPAKEGTTT